MQSSRVIVINQLSTTVSLGRCGIKKDRLIPYWPLSGMEIMIQCTYLSIQIDAVCTDHAPWIVVWADGSMIARFPAQHGLHWYPLLMGMDASVPHRISIVNDTQPIEGSGMGMAFCAIETDGELLPLSTPAYHFEFVGDSLTTGEGCIGPVSANEWKSIWMCPSQGYAHFLGNAMQAQCSLVSQSGWGVYCDWAGNLQNNLPRIYDQLCGVIPEGQTPYDFSQPMDAVVINLGTNDISALKNLSDNEKEKRAELLTNATATFLQQLRKYHPYAYLLWVYGMCGQDYIHCFRQGVENAKASGDTRMGFCPLPPCTREDTGSRMHPGPLNHMKAAQAIFEHLQAVLT